LSDGNRRATTHFKHFLQAQSLGAKLQGIVRPISHTTLFVFNRIDDAVAFFNEVCLAADAIAL
jgi:hypothetical protein